MTKDASILGTTKDSRPVGGKHAADASCTGCKHDYRTRNNET
jgi:hypothetical protein